MDADSLANGVAHLAEIEPAFADLRDWNGIPPLWERDPGFATLVRFILEQQVSLASADAAYARLDEAIDEVSPDEFLTLGDERLRDIGFSRQKAGYARGLADGLVEGSIALDGFGAQPDDEVTAALEAIRGIGPWTASCYLLFVLRRPDAWPSGDRALYVSMANVFDLGEVPEREAADAFAANWSPYRAVAARMLWHDYLGGDPVRPALQ